MFVEQNIMAYDIKNFVHIHENSYGMFIDINTVKSITWKFWTGRDRWVVYIPETSLFIFRYFSRNFEICVYIICLKTLTGTGILKLGWL